MIQKLSFFILIFSLMLRSLSVDVEVNVPTLTIPFEIFCHNGTIIILSSENLYFHLL